MTKIEGSDETIADKKNGLKGGFSVAGVAAFIIAYFAVQFLMSNGKPNIEKLKDEFKAEFSASAVGATIRENFPEDYANGVASVSALLDDKTLDKRLLGQKAAKVLADIRVKYSRYAGRASDASLRKVLESYVAMLDATKSLMNEES